MILANKNIKDKIKNIKIFLFDLDGVIVLKKEEENSAILKCMEEFTLNLSKNNYHCGIITARSNDELTSKLSKIDNCQVVTASFNKVSKVEKILEKLNFEFNNVLYIGDDMLDIPLLQKAGIAVAPSSARREVKRVVDFTVDVSTSGSILHSIYEIIERYK